MSDDYFCLWLFKIWLSFAFPHLLLFNSLPLPSPSLSLSLSFSFSLTLSRSLTSPNWTIHSCYKVKTINGVDYGSICMIYFYYYYHYNTHYTKWIYAVKSSHYLIWYMGVRHTVRSLLGNNWTKMKCVQCLKMVNFQSSPIWWHMSKTLENKLAATDVIAIKLIVFMKFKVGFKNEGDTLLHSLIIISVCM